MREVFIFFHFILLSITMSCVSDLSQSNEYLSFRSSIPLRKVVVDSDGSKVMFILLSRLIGPLLATVIEINLIYCRHGGYLIVAPSRLAVL